MKHLFNLLGWCACALPVLAQPTPPTPTSTPALSIETIMQDPRQWVGTSPSGVFWSDDSRTIYFSWHDARSADKALGDSLYKITLPAPGTVSRNAAMPAPVKVSIAERRLLPSADDRPIYNRARTLRLYEKYGDIFLLNRQAGPSGPQVRMLTSTVERESNPIFSGDEKAVLFTRSQNLYRLDLTTGFVEQLTNFDPAAKKPEAKPTDQESWLKKDQLALFDVLRLRKAKRDESERTTKAEQPRRPKSIGTDGRTVMNASLSPDGRLVTYNLMRSASSKSTIVPNFITESGFTEDLPARTKVGAPLAAVEFMVYDIRRDTALTISLASLPGITDKPDYLMPAAVTSGSATSAGRSTVAASEKTAKDTTTARKGTTTAKPANRPVYVSMPVWAEGPTARYGVVSIRALDNKDRWLMLVDTETPTTMKLLDRQRDEAWVGGPGIGGAFSPGTLGWLDAQTIYYQSEADGYSHLYTQNVLTGQKTQLTKGRFEVQQVMLSADKRFFYLTTNERHPGEQHLYRMATTVGRDGSLPQRTQLTTLTGANDVTLSPDESRMVIRYSATNKPWELYLLDGIKKKGTEPVAFSGSAVQLTQSTTASFQAYPWREPAVVTIQARDGQPIYARLYQPAANASVKATGKAVVFVHGAGYLQNAHKWWSQYFREYMFHNLLVDKGYTVLDIDYRASAGYGRDWRTGIYRFMGGKDLTDHVDAAAWLVKNHGVDPKRIGIYGGSYGGFITLMAMFTAHDAAGDPVFKAGAALRPVTDWAAYNHGYTSNILNEPYADTLAYRRSSPIYHAAGLKGHLLICHGMVDVNVHFQDAVRLAQRLIELKKENWELAAYPVEDHGFVEPTSWMDEYKRILKLFDERL